MSYKPRHARRRHQGRKTALAVGTAALTVAGIIGGVPSAHASESLGNRALDWAESHAYGKPYAWGGTGPYSYDCSGLVVTAFKHMGLTLPRTTYSMVYSPHLVRVYSPQRGDLAFWGPASSPYHVEFVTVWYHQTFGAHDYGQPVGWVRYGGSWSPSGFYRVEW